MNLFRRIVPREIVCGILVVWLLATAGGCTTKGDMRREQEMDRLRSELKEMKGNRVDIDVVGEELKTELQRIQNIQDEQVQLVRQQNEELKKEIAALTGRIATLETRPQASAEEQRPVVPAVVPDKAKPTYEMGKKLYDEGKFTEASDVLKLVAKSKPQSDEGKKAQFLLAESYYADKEYASAALEFSEFKKNYPKDALVPNATYRQAHSFRAMGKKAEAKLFYQELLEKFPKNSFSAKARSEMKKLK